jgi:hypothetical protein
MEYFIFFVVHLDLEASNAIAIDGHLINIDHGREDFNVPERELSSLAHKVSVDVYGRTAVKVQAVAVAAAMIRKQVHTAALFHRILYEIDTTVRLSQLMMTTARIRYYVHTIQSQTQMGP